MPDITATIPQRAYDGLVEAAERNGLPLSDLAGDILRQQGFSYANLFQVGVLTSAGFVARLTRSAMLEVLRADYVRSARAKGLHRFSITFTHALRNAILPVITLQGLQFGTLLGGALITELVFAWPGLGRMLLDGILRRDYAVVQGTVIFVAFFYVVVNLMVDLLYRVVDPRLRS